MRKHLSLLCSLGLVLMIVSCAKEKVVEHPYAGLSSEYYDSFSDKALTADAQEIRDNILTIVKADRDSLKADRYTRAHYKYFSTSPSAFLWIDRKGVSTQADTLLACLDSCDREGFEKRQFGVEYIRKDLETLRNLSFEPEGKNSINRVLARLEYNLTKAFLRYAVGQRYGFTNPFDLLNRLDVRDSDSVRLTYRQLFDDSIHICGKQTFYGAINAIKHDSVGIYLAKAMAHTPIYNRIKEGLKNDSLDRKTILVNLERARWKPTDAPHLHDEYVIVNIPAFHLWAMRDKRLALDMKIGCGSTKTKTPLLHSKIKRMELNPQWVIPWSIRKKEINGKGGNADYFYRNHYFARNKKTGAKLTGAAITNSIIMSPDWSIVQEGGDGNSLGRIIFRFDNNFSIYVHDTSTPSVFQRKVRSVSHGCIRVEKPYELACYLLRNKDPETAEKIKYSMEADMSSPKREWNKLIGSKKVDPQVPIFIVYYTLFPVPEGELQSFPDIYGYDSVIAKALRAI